MPRDHARVNIAIWQDPNFRDLPPLAQHLYFVLWTHPDLSYAGVVDWRPGRLAAQAGGWTRTDVNTAADCLEHRLFIVRDNDTEECLIRSWVKWDGLLKQPVMAVSFANAYAATASNTIRGVIVHEAKRIHDKQPELAGWGKPQVRDLLTNPTVDPRTRDLPTDPFTPHLTPSVTPPLTPALTPALTPHLTIANPSPNPTPNTPPTPTPSPTPSLPGLPAADATDDNATKTSRRKPERPLPQTWKPNTRHHEIALENHLDITTQVAAFRNHAETHDRRARDWDAAFRTWLDKATNRPGQHRPNRNIGVDQWLA